MKIIQYCQHVLGIGHLVRTLEILKALEGHEIILVNGGAPVEFPLPAHVREYRLPVLMMDARFKKLLPVESGVSVEAVKAERQKRLSDLFDSERPDLFLVELFPFGRRAFAFELEPVLRAIRESVLPPCFVACSLRDILVESKKYWDAYEKEVVGRLNAYFDALFIHSDPEFLRLEETFTRCGDIHIPMVYTGFVAQRPEPGARGRIRRSLNLTDGRRLVVASVGGGKVGFPLLRSVYEAHRKMRVADSELYLTLFTGPFMDQENVQALEAGADERVRIQRFTTDFLSHMAAADLSVSMAGYNTCMNVIAAGVPALVQPFDRNREQRMRAERLADIGAVEIIEEADLRSNRLFRKMTAAMAGKRRLSARIDLNGAEKTAQWLNRRLADSKAGTGQ